MNSFDVLTQDAFEALEVRQSHLAMERLDTMLNRLQDLEDFLDDCIEQQALVSSNRNTSIPTR